jgi:hypothetical protein
MKSRVVVLLASMATLCAGCDKLSPVHPSSVVPPSQPRASVRQMSTLPDDGATLAYGQPGKVEIAYTLQGDIASQPPIPREDWTHVPPQYLARPTYQMRSCLSLDGMTCIVSASVSPIGGSDGTVWNTLALSETFRGRVDQTMFVVHQLTVTRSGVTDVVAREVRSLHWHFR